MEADAASDSESDSESEEQWWARNGGPWRAAHMKNLDWLMSEAY